MANCECLAGCPFFNDKMDGMAAMTDIYKKKYCLGDFEKCARYMVFKKLGKPAVPKTMFPNNVEQAKRILASAGV